MSQNMLPIAISLQMPMLRGFAWGVYIFLAWLLVLKSKLWNYMCSKLLGVQMSSFHDRDHCGSCFWKILCSILLQHEGEQTRVPLQPGPAPLRMRKSLEQKGHLSLLLGNKSTFVLLAKLKECHYYQINCVVTNQSSHLSFKCESL